MGVSPAQPVRVSTVAHGPVPQVAPGPSAGQQCSRIPPWPCHCTELPGLDVALPTEPDTRGTTLQGAMHCHDSTEGSTAAASTSGHLVRPQVGPRTPHPSCLASGTAARSALAQPHTALGSAQPRRDPEPTSPWQETGAGTSCPPWCTGSSGGCLCQTLGQRLSEPAESQAPALPVPVPRGWLGPGSPSSAFPALLSCSCCESATQLCQRDTSG